MNRRVLHFDDAHDLRAIATLAAARAKRGEQVAIVATGRGLAGRVRALVDILASGAAARVTVQVEDLRAMGAEAVAIAPPQATSTAAGPVAEPTRAAPERRPEPPPAPPPFAPSPPEPVASAQVVAPAPALIELPAPARARVEPPQPREPAPTRQALSRPAPAGPPPDVAPSPGVATAPTVTMATATSTNTTKRSGSGRSASKVCPVEPASVPEPPADELVDFPLDSIALPARVRAYAYRKDITTLRQLARVPIADLRGASNLGRASIAQTRAVVEKLLGHPWEHFAERRLGLPRGPRPRPDPWDAVRGRLPEKVRAVRLEDLELSVRVRAYITRMGLVTVGDLAKRSARELKSSGNFGEFSLANLLDALWDRLRTFQVPVPKRLPLRQRHTKVGPPGATVWQPDATPPTRALGGGAERSPFRAPVVNLLESWKERLQKRDGAKIEIVLRRSGLAGEAEGLRALAQSLGLTRAQLWTREQAVIDELCRDRLWLAEAHRQIDAVLGDGAVSLETLAKDPWWAAIVAMPEALDYFGQRVLGHAFRIVRVQERAYLARCMQNLVDDARATLRRVAIRLPVPMPLAEFRSNVMRDVYRVGSVLMEALWEERLSKFLVDTAHDPPRVLGRKARSGESAVATLKASPHPMPLNELLAVAGAKGLPAEILYFGPELVGLKHHFPEYEIWAERLLPVAFAAMKGGEPGRPWSQGAVLEGVRRTIALPAWLDEWHMGALLSQSPRIRRLRSGGLVLVDALGSKRHHSLNTELLRILREHGKPIPEDTLVRELGGTSFPLRSIQTALMGRRFLRCDAAHYGLASRDLPGGLDARELALNHVAAELERIGRGLGDGELLREIQPLSASHAKWTREMCASVVRSDPRFWSSKAGGAGLATWEAPRVLRRDELLSQCLEEAGGRASVKTVEQRILAYYGKAMAVAAIRALAKRLGAALKGDWIQKLPPPKLPQRRRSST